MHGPKHKSLIFDLGGLFFLERIKFYPRERHLHDRFVESFTIGISDGDPFKDPHRELQAGVGDSAGGLSSPLTCSTTSGKTPSLSLS